MTGSPSTTEQALATSTAADPAPMDPAVSTAVAVPAGDAGSATPASAAPKAPGAGGPRKGKSRSRIPKKGKIGYRTFWALAAAGIILLAAGFGLLVTFYPYVVHAETAEQFLVNTGAQSATSNSLSFVYLTKGVSAGDTVVIQDTVSQVLYNASSGTTQLTFQSIANLAPAARATYAPLAVDLFATVQGNPSWISSGTPVVMTFTVVEQKLPGGPYSGQNYLTLDAAADATNHAIATGASGAGAVAIGPQYFQPYPAPAYDYLFYFLIVLGALCLVAGILWARRLERWLRSHTKEPKPLAIGLIGVLALLGGFFLPFYPWPYVVFIIVPAVMLIAWRFPQLALIALVLLVIPEVGYQSGALGLVFLFACLPVLYAALLDWRFGVGVFMTLFLAPIGLSFTIPIFLALIFSIYVGIAVAVVGGILITLFVTLGNLPVFGYLVGPGSQAGATLVAGHSAALKPTLPIPYFSFAAIGNAYANIISPDFSAFTNGGSSLGSIAIPLIEIGAWCFAAYFVATALKDREDQTFDKIVRSSMVGGGAIAGVTLIAFALQRSVDAASLIVLLFVPATIAAVAGSMVIKDAFEAYFTSQLGGSGVGSRVAEMKGLQKTTFEMVGGLHDVKADIKESMIIPLTRRDVTTRFKLEPPKGILLFGPPGCGKTMLMKALATELGVEMISIKCSDLMSKWYGESEGRIAQLLKTARERAPCIVFMDEIDSVAKRRDMYTADDVTPRLLSILLSEMDGIDKSAGVIVIGSTNKPDLIDPALMRPGRLDKIMYVPPPDFNERMEIVHVHLQGRPLANDIDLAEIAKKTERFSGADLANLVREAATIAVKTEMTTGVQRKMQMSDFREVLPRIKPSISLRMINDYETMKMDYERKMHAVQRTERRTVVHWDDVGGLEQVKRSIREYVELPLLRPELMENYRIKSGRGILLFGPPGCGKTHVMRAAANELNVPMQIVNGPELVSALAGESEAAVRDVLYRARENAPSIVFFDEIDALASKDSMKTPEVSRAVSQFLTEMDGLKPKDKVIIIATTNRPQTLDPALLRPGRFDKIFYVPPPDEKARVDILKIHLRGIPIDGPQPDYPALSKMTAGFSGADIASAVEEAKLIALRQQLSDEIATRDGTPKVPAGLFSPVTAPPSTGTGGSVPIGVPLGDGVFDPSKMIGLRTENLIEAIRGMKSSITPETLAWAEEFIRTYGTRN
jgi:transitional endoplasmic reticulum ATPase